MIIGIGSDLIDINRIERTLARFGEPSPSDLPPRAREVLRCLLEGDTDARVANYLGRITQSVDRMGSLLDGLSVLAHVGMLVGVAVFTWAYWAAVV